GDARDAALIDGRNVVPEVVVVHTVDLPVDLVRPGAIERTEAAHVVAAEARCNTDHLREVPAVERNVLHHIVGDGHCLRLCCGVESQGSGGYFYCRGLLLQRKSDVQCIDLARANFYLVHGVGWETRRCHRDFVLAQWNVLKGKGSIISCCCSVVNPRGTFRDLDCGVWNRTARWVGHCSVDGAAERLRVHPHCERQNNHNC